MYNFTMLTTIDWHSAEQSFTLAPVPYTMFDAQYRSSVSLAPFNSINMQLQEENGDKMTQRVHNGKPCMLHFDTPLPIPTEQQHDSEQPNPQLPPYWLNVQGLVCRGMPKLKIGIRGKETVSTAGTIKDYFHGQLCSWADFHLDVVNFWTEERMLKVLKQCEYLPVGPDPNIEKLNPHAMTVERIQCGGEITISGRFYSNALEPVIHCAETLGAAGGHLPKKITFGDAWIRGTHDRVPGQHPDVIGKIEFQEKDEVRLLGEVKFPLTVNIAKMLEYALDNIDTTFRAILGQVVKYMLSHRLRYAFLTNYNDTIFLQLHHVLDGNGKPEPRIMFSKVIGFSDTVDVDKNHISVRLALLYLVYKTFTEDKAEWQISQELLDATNNDEWITNKIPSTRPLNTPYGTQNRSLRQCSRPMDEDNEPVLECANSDPFAASKNNATQQLKTLDGRRMWSTKEDLRTPSGTAFETPSKAPYPRMPLHMAVLDRLEEYDDPSPQMGYGGGRMSFPERLRATLTSPSDDSTESTDSTQGEQGDSDQIEAKRESH